MPTGNDKCSLEIEKRVMNQGVCLTSVKCIYGIERRVMNQGVCLVNIKCSLGLGGGIWWTKVCVSLEHGSMFVKYANNVKVCKPIVTYIAFNWKGVGGRYLDR